MKTASHRGSTTQPKRRASVLIVDDHPIVRYGLAELLCRQPDLEVCGEAGSVAEAMERAAATVPQAVVVDVRLGEESGLDLIERLHAKYPDVRILFFSTGGEEALARQAMQQGALGVATKVEPVEQLLAAIRCVLRGEVYVSPQLALRAATRVLRGSRDRSEDPTSLLSHREMDIFERMGRGETIRGIARALGIKPSTVETHRRKIKDKLGVTSGAEVSYRAIRWMSERD